MRYLAVSIYAFAIACGVHPPRLGPSDLAGCYRFDRAYFGWSRSDSTGRPTADTSGVVQLSALAHDPYPLVPRRPSVRVVKVPLLRGSPGLAAMWLGPSYWEPVGPDSAVIVWRDGFVGPVFRVQLRGDSLVGNMRWTTDEPGRIDPLIPARAIRIVCPNPAPAA